MIHELKTHPEYFTAVLYGKKNFEVRKDDRDFKVGDDLHLREYNPETQSYTGVSTHRAIQYILKDPQYVKEGYVIMGLE